MSIGSVSRTSSEEVGSLTIGYGTVKLCDEQKMRTLGPEVTDWSTSTKVFSSFFRDF